MTVFGEPVDLPWRRDPSVNSNSYSDMQQEAVRLSADIALVAYGETVYVNWPDDPWSYQVAASRPTLAAVRYTDEGPVVGPTKELPSSIAYRPHYLEALIAGAENEAWLLTTTYNNDYVNGTNIYNSTMQLARITVNPTTLALTVQWRWTMPAAGYGAGYIFADIWQEQRLLVLANMSSKAPGGGPAQTTAEERSAQLLNLDTGALVARIGLPIASGSTRAVYVKAFAFHQDRKEILIAGERITGGYDRPTIWTAPVTPTSIGAWTRVEIPTVTGSYYSDVYIDAAFALPVSSTQYQLAVNWSRDDDYRSPYYYGSQKVRNYSFPPISEYPILLSELGHYDNMEAARALGMAMRDDQFVVAVVETTDRTVTSGAGTTGGVKHIEMSADRSQPAATVTLPKTQNILDEQGSVSVVALGAGRYIYLVSGQAITVPYTTELGSLQFLVYAGGPVQKPPFVPGIKGEAPDENRRAFRRVN